MFEDLNLLFSTMDHEFDKNQKKSSKKVSFSKYVYICLIPIYYEMDHYRDLWWSDEDLLEMRINAMKEIQQLMTFHPSMEISHAKKLLFQPNNIRYDPQNFVDCE
jgi:hypothetical protein